MYDLPQYLLATLTTKNDNQPTNLDTSAEAEQKNATESLASVTPTSCRLCGVSFLDVREHRDHVRSDQHRYNVKEQLRGNPTLDEATFNEAIGDLDESISGSESSQGEEDEGGQEGDEPLDALLKRQARISDAHGEEKEGERLPMTTGKNPLFWLTSSLIPPDTFLGVYRALFTKAEQEDPKRLVDVIRRKQLPEPTREHSSSARPVANPPHVFLCMIGGGHFAAMLVSLVPEIHRRQGGIESREPKVIAHKTFHRYTTRRKQGGSQSTSDSSRGAAHSAGSSLRRYNEAALEHEVRELLSEWRSMINQAELLFIRATGNTNRRILFGSHEGQFLKQNDPRLRGFPFSTRRPTQAELVRCFKELTRLKVSRVDEKALAAAAAEAKRREEASKSQLARTQEAQEPRISKEDETAMLHTSQIQALIRRSKIPALLSYISKNSIPSTFTFQPADYPHNFRCPTPLHLAANSNASSVVLALLTKSNFDPTEVNGEGRTPFELASDRPTRDAFRIARHELGESRWDWDAAHVPSALSKAEVESRLERDRKASEEGETNRRKAEMERLRKEDAERAARSGPKKPGGRILAAPAVEKTAQEKREDEMRGMSPEMRMKLERERRARAAEERIRRTQGK